MTSIPNGTHQVPQVCKAGVCVNPGPEFYVEMIHVRVLHLDCNGGAPLVLGTATILIAEV